MPKKWMSCCICQARFHGYGNNPYPIREKGRCCDTCNFSVVVPQRIAIAYGFRPKPAGGKNVKT